MLKPTDIAAPLFVLLIALEALIDARRKANEYEARDAFTNIFVGLVSLVFGAAFGLIQVFFYESLYKAAPFKMPMESWWAWILLFFLDDFAYYWFHRISHRSRVFWNFHVVHHSSQKYNLSVAVRQSWFGNIVHWIFYVPIGLLGFPLWSFALMHGFNLIYQFWIHTNFIKKLGFFEHVFNTPSHHRVHHGVNDQYLDKNYAGVLIIWDKIFGTFVKETETPRYGIVKPLQSYNPLWINTHAWSEMFASMRERKTFAGKLRCLFGSPNMDF
jgi:sterol desaturase/sphingolipid hydroxylase (fatty acid hydroxylase superfamily)